MITKRTVKKTTLYLLGTVLLLFAGGMIVSGSIILDAIIGLVAYISGIFLLKSFFFMRFEDEKKGEKK